MREMVLNFVYDGEVNFKEMITLGLIEKSHGGYALTIFGKSFLGANK